MMHGTTNIKLKKLYLCLMLGNFFRRSTDQKQRVNIQRFPTTFK